MNINNKIRYGYTTLGTRRICLSEEVEQSRGYNVIKAEGIMARCTNIIINNRCHNLYQRVCIVFTTF